MFFKDVRCYVAQLGVLDHSALFEFRPPAFLSGDIFIFHAKINSSTFFISTYRTVCWQNGWIYWGFPHITCRHEAAAGSKYRQPNNLVIALCRCSEESGRWMFCPTRHPFWSQGLRQFSVIFMGSSKWWHFSQTHLCCWCMSVWRPLLHLYIKQLFLVAKKYLNHNYNNLKRFLSGLFTIFTAVFFSLFPHFLFPSKPQIKGALCCFGE